MIKNTYIPHLGISGFDYILHEGIMQVFFHRWNVRKNKSLSGISPGRLIIYWSLFCLYPKGVSLFV